MIFRKTSETSINGEKRGLLEDVAFPLTRLWNKRTLQEAQALVGKVADVSPEEETAQVEKDHGPAKEDLSPEASAKVEDPLKAVGDGVTCLQKIEAACPP